MDILDLAGTWEYMTDKDGVLDVSDFFAEGLFSLPGTTCENGIGKKQELYDSLTKETVRAPRERFEYVGVLWLRRDVLIPEAMAGKCARVFLERVNVCSSLFWDGVRVGRPVLGLSTPHIYDVSGILTPGRHTLTVRLDNRNLINFGDMASAYSIDTQGLWCGIVGRIELRAENVFHIENVQIYPETGGALVRLTLASDILHPYDRRTASVRLTVSDPSGHVISDEVFSRTLYNPRQPESFRLCFDAPEWDEFSPALCTLSVDVSFGCVSDTKSVRFGNRTVAVKDKFMTINGRPLSLRGTIDCAQYPLTGYPPFDISVWRKNFETIKSYGLNHVRFHAWCPPECAFDAADEAGIYLSVEMPLWINRDICGLDYGDDAIHDVFYPHEARLISKTYGNHPSFIMFSNGNETMGDLGLLSDITRMMKSYDPRRLYTVTSNFDHPVIDCEDYTSASDIGGIPVRIQNIHEEVAASTGRDYSEAVKNTPVPIVTFEVGQYCSFPDVDVISKYKGNMLPVNFDAIKKHMTKHGVYGRLKEYVHASGRLAARLYKEDIEAALRTHGLGGFQLLSLADYTGQSTATVGMLDVFYDSKNFITPEEFRRFCSPVVPLFRAGRIFKTSDTLEAELDLYDFGRMPISDPEFTLTLRDGDDVFFETTTKKRRVFIPLGAITRPTALSVTLSVGQYSNSWRVFVYPYHHHPDDDAPAVDIVSDRDALERLAEKGGFAVVSPALFSDVVKGSFIPVFWSPVHFPTNRPSGAIINSRHPLLAGFPTEDIPDYQWKTLLDNSNSADISGVRDVDSIVELVPNFVDCTPRSPLFEVSVGKARVLVCGFDLSQNDPPTICMRRCISEYAASRQL